MLELASYLAKLAAALRGLSARRHSTGGDRFCRGSGVNISATATFYTMPSKYVLIHNVISNISKPQGQWIIFQGVLQLLGKSYFISEYEDILVGMI